jgi:O-antigen/teichoic acid export membrane protein
LFCTSFNSHDPVAVFLFVPLISNIFFKGLHFYLRDGSAWFGTSPNIAKPQLVTVAALPALYVNYVRLKRRPFQFIEMSTPVTKDSTAFSSLLASGAKNETAGAPGLTFTQVNTEQLKKKSIKGGILTFSAQFINFLIQTASVAVLARLLSPSDFGLQGMVVALTGFLGMFRDIGLSAATVQKETVTEDQLSTLFWINILVGCILTVICIISAPAIVLFYHEPRLYWITVISGSTFLFSSAGAQHSALLQRMMRYGALAKINIVSLGLSTAIGILFAAIGFGYWALVLMAWSSSLISLICFWLAVKWRPGFPAKGTEIKAMLRFGGTVTLNNLVVYIAYNLEKVLLGRSWGAESLGLYGRAYQLINLPMQQLNSSLYLVAFSALSRIQSSPERLARSFLQGYALLLSITIPVTLSCAVFAEEIITMLLGAKWLQAAPILRLLTPTILVFGIINPFGWFLIATGRTTRSLNMALVIMPTVIAAIVLGLPHGPRGVAFSYSAAMSLLMIPMVLWAIHGTAIARGAYLNVIKVPILAGVIAFLIACAFKLSFPGGNAVIHLFLGVGGLFLVYFGTAFLFPAQRQLFSETVQQFLKRKGTQAV